MLRFTELWLISNFFNCFVGPTGDKTETNENNDESSTVADSDGWVSWKFHISWVLLSKLCFLCRKSPKNLKKRDSLFDFSWEIAEDSRVLSEVITYLKGSQDLNKEHLRPPIVKLVTCEKTFLALNSAIFSQIRISCPETRSGRKISAKKADRVINCDWTWPVIKFL